MSDWRTNKKKKDTKPTKKVVASVTPKKVENSKNTRKEPKKELTGIEKRMKNLIPGANKNGRPKGKLNFDTRVDMAIEVLAQKFVLDTNEKNKKKKKYIPLTLDDVDIEGDIFAQFINKARNGNEKMIDSFLDRRHGKATQPIEMSGKNGNPIEYSVKLEEAKKRLKQNQDKWFKK